MEQEVTRVNEFCKSLRANKVKNSQELFVKLSENTQKLFLENSLKILSKKEKYSEESYRTAFYLFKLFKNKDMKGLDSYDDYRKNTRLDVLYKLALEWNKETKSKSTSSRSKKSYDKEYQKYDSPEDDGDPLYIFYTTLYEQRPDSRLAITWLTEHGVFEDERREELTEKYKVLAEEKRLIK